MKDKKRKKAIRAQKARMGEETSYSAARLVLTRSRGEASAEMLTLEDRIRAVIPLAAAAAAAESKGLKGGSVRVKEVLPLRPPTPDETALDNALRLFSLQDLYRVETVMYAGRELEDTGDIRSDYARLHRTLSRDDREVTMNIITEKLPRLTTYLERGLELARRTGISLSELDLLPSPTEADQPEITAPPPPPPQVPVAPEDDHEFHGSGFQKRANVTYLTALRRATGDQTLVDRTWTDPKEIIEVLRTIGVPNSNQMFFPTSGGNDLARAIPAREAGCIELFCNGEDEERGSPEIVKPRSLTLNVVEGIPSMSYLRLELDELAPSGVYDSVPNGREELLEMEPGQYEDRSLWDNGEHGPSDRLVTRWLRGSLVIFAKGSLYNLFSDYWKGDTYDGRHNKMDAADFRKYVERIVGDAIARGLPTY